MAVDAELYFKMGETYLEMYNDDEDNENAKSSSFDNFKKAADLGHAGACFLVGTYYFNGAVVSQDKAKAIEWWKKAAAKGQPDAIKQLAELGISTAPSSTSSYTPPSSATSKPAAPVSPKPAPAPVSNVWQYKAPTDGHINETYKDYGDRVKKGAKLFELDIGRGSNHEYIVVKAEIDGTVKFHIQAGSVKAGQVILEIIPK